MRTLEEILNELRDFLKEKILNGKYDFVECSKYVATIEIDGIRLGMWIANNPAHHFDLDFSLEISSSPIRIFKTDEERLKGYETMKPFIEEYKSRNPQLDTV